MFAKGDKIQVDPNSQYLKTMLREGLELNVIYTITEITPDNSVIFITGLHPQFGYNDECFIPIQIKQIDWLAINKEMSSV